MYTFSIFSNHIFRDSDNLDITDLPTEYAEYQLWSQTNTPNYVEYHESEYDAYASFQINILTQQMRDELAFTSSNLCSLFFEQIGEPVPVMQERLNTYDRYKALIFAYDPDYDFFGNMKNLAKPDFVYRFTATEDTDHIIMPLTIGRDIIHEIHCDGMPVEFEQSQYNTTTRRLDIDILEGQKWKITI